VWRQPCKDRDSDAMCDVTNAMKLRRVVEICTKKISAFHVLTSQMKL